MIDINVKIQDFNIYDLFKSNTAEGGSSDVSVILVQNLEKKVFKKFEFIDDKNKKQDEESYKFKNEITNVKNLIDSVSKNLLNLKNDCNDVFNENNSIIEGMKERFEETDGKFDKLYNKIMENIEIKTNELKETHDNLLKVPDDFHNGKEDISKRSANVSDADAKLMKDFSKKVTDLEKNFKVFVTSINIDNIKSELSKLKEAVEGKANNSEVVENKDNISKINFLQRKKNLIYIY